MLLHAIQILPPTECCQRRSSSRQRKVVEKSSKKISSFAGFCVFCEVEENPHEASKSPPLPPNSKAAYGCPTRLPYKDRTRVCSWLIKISDLFFFLDQTFVTNHFLSFSFSAFWYNPQRKIAWIEQSHPDLRWHHASAARHIGKWSAIAMPQRIRRISFSRHS